MVEVRVRSVPTLSTPPLTVPQRYGLALHTSSPELGLAIAQLSMEPANNCSKPTPVSNPFSREIRCQTWNLGRNLSTQLHPYLAEFLPPQTWSDLAWIAVAIGPGSFTGTRMGVVTARTLAQQLDIPLFGISTLKAAAWFHRQGNISCDRPIALQMPAQRGELFVAIYSQNPEGGLTDWFSDRVVTPEIWQEKLARFPDAFELIQLEGGLGGLAVALVELANLNWQCGLLPHWSEVLPFYGQHPVVI
ncbi:MAG: tRNA (adenosine(37)-N6)-threonylcarbamoyltransferase complex dimerization subunit type 1 TsaB [Oscillatoriales cyanobacterium RM2_1_1]|nr:tRNA (adenosine(37)-N6)-threonylcarbamoyltransferase complex dimerization subunit type 1 TsaB [Oscillatoriales cyanobacterium SM2_3_0]NJO45771.1 tRNA (adenosine(37)-N6)-threonylcarbamoyltransferase complex dimerization subunit type 1 TsaB [Oscillatoriales cyanobacterium RM2_1_1]